MELRRTGRTNEKVEDIGGAAGVCERINEELSDSGIRGGAVVG